MGAFTNTRGNNPHECTTLMASTNGLQTLMLGVMVGLQTQFQVMT